MQTSLDLHDFYKNRDWKMEGNVVHAGVIQEVSKDKLTVSIINASACSACHAKGACLASDMKEKEIDIYNFTGEYHIGQHVNILGKSSQGYKAAFYGYILPFLIVFITLILSVIVTKNDALSGILSLAVLIPYFAILYLFRNKLRSTFDFEISSIN